MVTGIPRIVTAARVEPLERKHRSDPLLVGSILLVARAPGLKLVMLIMSRVFLAPLVAFHFHAHHHAAHFHHVGLV
jgi:hypothetical protein